jgi:hypothetical protein
MNIYEYLDELRRNSDEPGAYIRAAFDHEPDPRLLPRIDDDLKVTGALSDTDDRGDVVLWRVSIGPSWASEDNVELALDVRTTRDFRVISVKPADTTGEYVRAALAIADRVTA